MEQLLCKALHVRGAMGNLVFTSPSEICMCVGEQINYVLCRPREVTPLTKNNDAACTKMAANPVLENVKGVALVEVGRSALVTRHHPKW